MSAKEITPDVVAEIAEAAEKLREMAAEHQRREVALREAGEALERAREALRDSRSEYFAAVQKLMQESFGPVPGWES